MACQMRETETGLIPGEFSIMRETYAQTLKPPPPLLGLGTRVAAIWKTLSLVSILPLCQQGQPRNIFLSHHVSFVQIHCSAGTWNHIWSCLHAHLALQHTVSMGPFRSAKIPLQEGERMWPRSHNWQARHMLRKPEHLQSDIKCTSIQQAVHFLISVKMTLTTYYDGFSSVQSLSVRL